MDENHKNKTGSKLRATESELWIPPLPPKDQERLDHLRSKQEKAGKKWISFSERTLWDWLNLLGVLAIPLVVTFIGIYFTQQFTQQQAQASEKQHQIDLQIAQDQQRETTLQTYLDDMSDLLLNHQLRTSKTGDEVSEVARERTLTTLRRLDASRNKVVLQFLQDTHLINQVIDLNGADLSNDDLRGADLEAANLNYANLYNADLQEANLRGAHLHETNFSGANLNYADLSEADLSGAILIDAHLNADLSGANLNYANLYGVSNVDQEAFNRVSTCKNAILPEGLTCYKN